MMKNSIIPVVLCGGAGTRLWPLSRPEFPKQFLVLSGSGTLFQQAVLRIHHFDIHEFITRETLIVTNEKYRFLVQDQLKQLEHVSARFLLEPSSRNTAPALTVAALYAISNNNEDPVLVVVPSDHMMTDNEAFQAALTNAIHLAESGTVVILGVMPDAPETGYGYIHLQGMPGNSGEYTVKQFVEKPSREKAETYLAEGNYRWNSGIIVLKARLWLKALHTFRPDMMNAIQGAWANKTEEDRCIRPERATFDTITADSIDYAVLEKLPGSDFTIKMLPLAAGWADLGTWDAIRKISEKRLLSHTLPSRSQHDHLI